MGLFSKKGGTGKQKGETASACETIALGAAEAPPPSQSRELSAPVARQPVADKLSSEARFTVYGKILSILGRQKPFAEMPLGQLAAMIGPAVDAGFFAVADGQSKDQSGPAMPIAFVIWARVSEDVDKKLSENLQGPVALTPQEWTSGDIHWLMLSVGPQQPIAAILKAVSQRLPAGQNFKMRFTDKDGQQKVGFVSVDEKPAEQAN